LDSKVIIIGSGPSGVQAALTLLKRGFRVEVIDGGETETKLPNGNLSFTDLKKELDDPWSFFLGKNLEGIISPVNGSIFEYPPSRNYLERKKSIIISNGFNIHTSMATGGLGIGWGANCAEFIDDDMIDFPFPAKELVPYYKKLSKRIKINGTLNDPVGEDLGKNTILSGPLKLSDHDQMILQRSVRKYRGLERLGIRIGRSRMAVRTRSDDPKACIYCGRCLWGCETQSIYTPLETLEDCKKYSRFKHYPGWEVNYFVTNESGIKSVNCISRKSGKEIKMIGDHYILAAGAINSGKIFLKTLSQDKKFIELGRNKVLTTKSLLDTKTIKIPYVLPSMLGHQIPKNYFQFNKLVMGLNNRNYKNFPKFVQGEILSLNSLIYHPLIESFPFGSKISSSLFFLIQSSLGAVTIFCPDRPSITNTLKLSPKGFEAHYTETEEQKSFADDIIFRTKKALRKLGAIVPANKILHLPNGSGLHYAGTIPMSTIRSPFNVDSNCRSYAYKNLFIVDGSVLPTLPSKSLTYTLMANAIRVSDRI